MRTGNASIKIVVTFGVALVLGVTAGGGFGHLLPSAHADPGKGPACDQGSEQGTWGFSLTGSIDSVGPIVGVGAETCDGTGHCTGSETDTIAGATVTHTFTTVETINPDCTGVSTITNPDGSSVHSAFVIVNGGAELDFIGTDPGASISGVQKRR
jgi:hypothetical protein